MLGEVDLLDGFENPSLIGFGFQEHFLSPVNEGRTLSRDGSVTRINSQQKQPVATLQYLIVTAFRLQYRAKLCQGQ
jgi:hypothetical protein